MSRCVSVSSKVWSGSSRLGATVDPALHSAAFNPGRELTSS